MNLPVLEEHQHKETATDLAALIDGEVRFDDHHRLLYSTDASLYQVEPIGVVFPANPDDVSKILRYCSEHQLAVLPRGGGTSLAGQCTNRAIVMDFSRMCRRVLSIDSTNRLAHVEPGITVDELNRATASTSLFFAPDPATVAQATIGGCIGNNAAGARSIRYGRTSENLAALDIILSTGERRWLEPGAGRKNPTALLLAQKISEVVREYSDLIRTRFPKTIRRNAGYGLDLILQQLDRNIAAEDLDLSGLICGSGGTLAAVVGAKLKLHPLPKFKALAIASFASVDEAMSALSHILTTSPSAVELLDDVVLQAAGDNIQCRKYLKWLPPINGNAPSAVLYIEYTSATSMDEINASYAKLNLSPLALYTQPAPMADLWALRKAGEPLLHGLSGHRKPHTFVEDNAVPVENLPRFVREFKKIVAKHGTKAAYYAHASVGVLHVRPLIDLHDPKDREAMRAIAVEIADLARDCGGVMSGEHGDGRVRGPLLERFFGPELMTAFRRVKGIFDPAGILNPGMITQPQPIETITENLRTDYVHLRDVKTFYDYSDQEGFRGALEMCNGAGVCRKTAGGTMCPSYRATLDERHATRGRGNALRTAITGQLTTDNSPKWDDPGTIETLDLCLSCKACKSECPSNVDVARLKAEYTAQRYAHKGAPLSAKLFGHIRTLNRLGSLMPTLANFIAEQPFLRMIMNELLGLAPQRSLPPFAKPLHFLNPEPRTRNPRVVLFGDCFTTYNEPHIGQAAIRVLQSLGYEVILPRTGCCGRAMISTGLLPDAIKTADQTLRQLQPFIQDDSVKAIVVAEPSCLSAMKDDWLQLKLRTPLDLRKQLAGKAFLIEEFIEKSWDQHPTSLITQHSAPSTDIVLHGHCHQKALWGDSTSANLLKRLFKNVTVLPSGCCGMAGSFGYMKNKYDVSMKIGELSVFPPIRNAPDATIVAPGTSCRHQIRDGTGREALHPVELIDQLMANTDTPRS